MIDNNIIQSIGAGSGIDTNSLVKQLTAIEKAAPQERIDSKRELTQTQISDFGLLSSALSTLKDAAKALTDPEALFSKSASFTQSDAIVPTSLDTDVQTGTYAFTATQTAQSQSFAFTGFANVTDAVGEGTLTFNFGAWARDGAGAINGAFTQDSTHDSATVTIDSSNNSLEGLRDAINAGNFGVSASIVFDGTDHHLTLLAESGEQNQLEIVASEAGASPTNTDGSGLSVFAFNTGVTGFEALETQRGQDAQLTVNGLSVSRSSNTISDVVDGLTLDLLKVTSVGETVSVTVSDDKNFAEENIRNFVTAYNTFLDAVDSIFGVNEVTNDEGVTSTVVGSLANDGLAKSALSRVRALIAGAIPGLSDSNLTSLTNIGIRTELDGKLTIEEEEFSKAFNDSFLDIQKLFAPFTSSSADGITINSFNDNTTAGQYDVVITQTPARGLYDGGAIAGGISFPLDTTGKTYTFSLDVNGTTSGTITIPTATYNNETELAGAIQSAINADTVLSAANAAVTVGFNSTSGGFDISSTQYGSSSVVSVLSASTDSSSDLGLTVKTGSNGRAVAGTVDGVTAFGSANVLLPALGQPGEGLAMLIGENATSATVNFSRGFAGELERLIDDFLSNSGPIVQRETTLQNRLESLDSEQEQLDRRIEAFEERLIQQYIAMERIISSLNSSGSFLDNLVDTLPFTSGNN
ncbi:flagellar filament capping protein FliD [Agarilytica rhodophyticola]|uniref:flagellar filament capping protein FliD n=1 Tax=Agarilytica rhodophyticola TaxID=1737490 RepID=UPI000B341FF6|nr:flagellar filament capping protein FliD [Agarilytica rhodophyticola]